MDLYKDEEIKEALENIKELKTLLNDKKKMLKPTLLSKDFVRMALFASIFLILTTIITAFAYSKYDSFWEFSLFLKAIIIISLLANLIQISIRKIKAVNKNTQVTISETLSDFYSVNIIILLGLAILFCIIFSSVTGLNWIYLPLLTVAYGLVVISLAQPINIVEFKFMGYFTIIVGILSMLFLQIPLLLLGFAMYSIIFFSYFIILAYARRVNN